MKIRNKKKIYYVKNSRSSKYNTVSEKNDFQKKCYNDCNRKDDTKIRNVFNANSIEW